MISSVNCLLNFDSGCIPDREFLVIGQNGANGSFLLHHAISSSIKEKRSVCLLSFVQKLHHYNSVSQKVGINLQASVQSNQVVFIDGLDELSKTFFKAGEPSEKVPDVLGELKKSVLAALPVLRKDGNRDPVIVIDDITVLLSMGLHVADVERFVHSLLWEAMCLGRKDSEVTATSGVSLVVVCSYMEEDTEALALWRYLQHLSTMHVDVVGLQTGYCKDVHGQVSVVWGDMIDAPRLCQQKKQQFKLLDSGVEFFAAGMSAAVL
ncbi:hypothetical protein BaRGS_00007385 [Batillaria attramentaria]|uniref:Elongator complex protein 6 n=1 Tax=Batillaria attramentaria TaxID=370345 RepID=A0ABD0LP06_9CAEN